MAGIQLQLRGRNRRMELCSVIDHFQKLLGFAGGERGDAQSSGISTASSRDRRMGWTRHVSASQGELGEKAWDSVVAGTARRSNG
jgi:hypothetical protein